MKANQIPAWFWETDKPVRDEILRIGPDLDPQRWVTNGHVMLRVDLAEEGDAPIVKPAVAFEQEHLSYVHKVLVAAMTEIISETDKAERCGPREVQSAYLKESLNGDCATDFACDIGDQTFGMRYVAWIESVFDLFWVQTGEGPAYAFDARGLRIGPVAVVQHLRPATIVQRLQVDEQAKKT